MVSQALPGCSDRTDGSRKCIKDPGSYFRLKKYYRNTPELILYHNKNL
jgi:hypothetical protein